MTFSLEEALVFPFVCFFFFPPFKNTYFERAGKERHLLSRGEAPSARTRASAVTGAPCRRVGHERALFPRADTAVHALPGPGGPFLLPAAPLPGAPSLGAGALAGALAGAGAGAGQGGPRDPGWTASGQVPTLRGGGGFLSGTLLWVLGLSH